MNARSQVDINEIQTRLIQPMSGPVTNSFARAYDRIPSRSYTSVKKRGRPEPEIAARATNSALLNENANKDSKVIPHPAILLAGIKHWRALASTCCRVT